MSTSRAALLCLAFAAAGCGDKGPFGDKYPDVCAKYPSRTCIGIGIDQCGDSERGIDQVQLSSETPGLIPNGSARTPATAGAEIKFPALVAVLPSATVPMGTHFRIQVAGYYHGTPTGTSLQVEGDLPSSGSSIMLNTDSGNRQCLSSNNNQNCSGGTMCGGQCCNGGACCDNGSTCVPLGQPCSQGVCQTNTAGAPSCASCGQAGMACCPGDSCMNGGCCSNGICANLGEECRGGAGSTVCVAGQCRPCGTPGQVCCANRMCPAGCCDDNNSCVGNGTACGSQTPQVCVSPTCVGCGAANQPCCKVGTECNTGLGCTNSLCI